MTLIFALLIAYQIKHFLADYPLQNKWMLGKFKHEGWKLPLAAHAGVHALFTLGIVLCVPNTTLLLAGLLAAFDFVVHFTMDRIKASPNLMGRWKPLTKQEYKEAVRMAALFDNRSLSPVVAYSSQEVFNDYMDSYEGRDKLRSNKLFWWALGFDQMVHHLTHYAIIFVLAWLA